MAKYPSELAMGLQQLIPVQNIYFVETRNGDKKAGAHRQIGVLLVNYQ